MKSAVLPEHHDLLTHLVAQGAGLNLAPTSATFPLGDAAFRQGSHGWELVWVQMWPDNKYAIHRQPFSIVTANEGRMLSLKDQGGALRGWIRTLDRFQRRECRWEVWVGSSEMAQRGREFAQSLLRHPEQENNSIGYRRFGGRV